ncbi:MAG: SMC family ATPase [Anaerotignum sp.]|nr:SMC family ATPase [Anaerotignum sp.]
MEGQPCPVCGSLEHPNPAAGESGALSEQELEELKAELDLSEKKVNRCYGAVVSVQTQVNGLKKQIEATEESVASRKEYMKTVLEQDDQGLLTDYANKKAEIALREFRQKLSRIQKLQVMVQEKQTRGKQLESLLKEWKTAEETAAAEFSELLKQYGFSSAEDYEQAHLPRVQREKLAKEVEDYRKKVDANQKLKEHLEQNISGQELIDTQPLRQQLGAITEEKEKALKSVKKQEQLLHEVERTYKELRSKRNKLEELSAEYGYIKELENIASGNNAKKLVFEQYVLASYFEEILSAANIRFKKMTSGRYEMHRSQEVGDGRTKDNLEIQVMDYYTGKHRSVRTLSGGESFKASLSLALGLSDVIQAMNGGIQVEALFIDEGFGSLDSESLDQACETLLSLVESDRLIGIISHVPELRERINKQIVINKQGSGSDITVVV